ncbi:hypothetical protein [Caballeronia sp. CLC5]|uniref:hypothetical protein n=1 Tax=Caballeronia sp. CLC5 TaxID=2906764 RepID=UPI001F198B56|nr:hypothetical protein [Caballeronia sp. CLC5]MCE4573991.1 hypothetical protein [Caballeronia sp. CLC5]
MIAILHCLPGAVKILPECAGSRHAGQRTARSDDPEAHKEADVSSMKRVLDDRRDTGQAKHRHAMLFRHRADKTLN